MPVLALTLLPASCSEETQYAPQPDAGVLPDGGPPPDAPVPDAASDADAADDADAAPQTQQLNFVFVHGLERTEDERLTAQDDLIDVEAYVLAAIGARAAAYEAERGVSLVVQSRRVNLYTDLNGELLSPSLDSESDGTGIPTAIRWREQLVAKIEQAYPNGERNLVLVAHSTGARASMEVAANVGYNAVPQTHDWGLTDRIAGVVTAHGAIDALENPAYEFVVPTGFHFGCVAVNEDGVCDYLAYVNGNDAADWVAQNRHALMLTSWADCGLAAWNGASDKTLPTAAMGSPRAWGMTMVPSHGTLVPAHGHAYGAFCHSDLTDPGSPQHQDAVAALGDHILDWLLVAAPRVASLDSPAAFIETPEQPADTLSESYPVLGDCGSGGQDWGAPEVVGVCLHPGPSDGDDHALGEDGLVVTDAAECGGAFAWKHSHQGELHAARLWYKSYAVPVGGGLLYDLPLD